MEMFIAKTLSKYVSEGFEETPYRTERSLSLPARCVALHGIPNFQLSTNVTWSFTLLFCMHAITYPKSTVSYTPRHDEGHTLGNVLRSIIAQYPDVQFCGYTVPHPAEAKMHFRIQAKHGRAADILRRGLEDLEKVCDYTGETFTAAWEKFEKSQNPMETD